MSKKKNRKTERPKHPFFQLSAEYCDYNLLAITVLLVCFGLIMLYSTSAYESFNKYDGNDMVYFKKQMFFSVLALVSLLFIMRVDYHYLVYFSFPLYIISIMLMCVVLVAGKEAYGATRWLQIGSFSFQPSEFAKIAVIIFLPKLMVSMGKKISTHRAMILLLILGSIQAACAFFLTDNLSTGIIIECITIGMIFVAQPHPRLLMVFVAVGTVMSSIVFIIIGNTMTQSDDFRIRRILAWMDPQANIRKEGYQVLQSLYAIGSGGFFGKGLGNSAQKLGIIPEAQNDMIFPIICEELGVFGAVVLMLMFLYLLYRLYFIAVNAPDMYGTMIVSGVFVHVAVQVIFNVCVAVNFMPTTGITLPFISYGGTSAVLLIGEIGMALSVSRRITFSTDVQKEN